MNAKEIEISEDDYEERLNELFGEVSVCGINFDAGTLLKEIDPIAFRCGQSDEETRWECTECGKEHEEQDEAEEFCQKDEEQKE